jgi:hypothetical protein
LNAIQHAYAVAALKDLERDWREQGRLVLPDLYALFDVAVKVRDQNSLTRRASLHELFSLYYEVLDNCLKLEKYQPGRPKAFAAYFTKAIRNRLHEYLGLTEREARRRQLLREYAYDTRDRWVSVTNEDVEWLYEVIQKLPRPDQWLLYQHYWYKRSFRDLAGEAGKGEDSLEREHDGILDRLRAAA